MPTLNQHIQAHYHQDGLYETILGRLRAQGIDLEQVHREHITGVDEFHVRGAAVSKELAAYIDLNGAKLLDVGCGIGGPCRMLAEEFGCDTTGIDLSIEFIRTAKKLSELVGLNHKTNFVQGDALHLPFADGAFDVVWTQHVQMNIPDKEKFYSEIKRVLRPGGHFIYYDIFKKGDGEIYYPVPWSEKPDLSFLFPVEELEKILTQLNLTKIKTTDQTKAGIDFFENMLDKLKKHGPPKMGLSLVMGESIKIKIPNLLNGLKTGKLMLQSGVYKN